MPGVSDSFASNVASCFGSLTVILFASTKSYVGVGSEGSCGDWSMCKDLVQSGKKMSLSLSPRGPDSRSVRMWSRVVSGWIVSGGRGKGSI